MVGLALVVIAAAVEVRDAPDAATVARADRLAAREAPGLVLWTPADVAGWSGPGLRGAEVVGLGGDAGTLWVATRAGGVAAWDGRAWRHVGRRSPLGTEHLLGLVVVGRDRWLATADGLRHVAEDGTVNAADDGPLGADGRPRPAAEVAAVFPDAVGAVARAGGWWVASPTQGLVAWVDGAATPAWTPPAPATDLLRLDDHLVLTTAGGEVWRYTPDGPVPVSRADGLPGAARRLAPGPNPAKVWVGTDHGVALLSRDGALTALPVAPLPAGVDVVALAGDADGVLAATTTGVAWVGERPPRGIDALVAAIGPVGTPGGAPDVAWIDGTWWAARDTVLLSLDPTGRLVRWDAGAAVTGLDTVPGGLAVRTPLATRFWAPGATQLSPRWDDAPPPGPTTVVRDRGTGWHADGPTLVHTAGGDRTSIALGGWLPVDGVRALVGDARAVWVATSHGLFRVASVGGPARF